MPLMSPFLSDPFQPDSWGKPPPRPFINFTPLHSLNASERASGLMDLCCHDACHRRTPSDFHRELAKMIAHTFH